jgi:Shugoshin C terminus
MAKSLSKAQQKIVELEQKIQALSAENYSLRQENLRNTKDKAAIINGQFESIREKLADKWAQIEEIILQGFQVPLQPSQEEGPFVAVTTRKPRDLRRRSNIYSKTSDDKHDFKRLMNEESVIEEVSEIDEIDENYDDMPNNGTCEPNDEEVVDENVLNEADQLPDLLLDRSMELLEQLDPHHISPEKSEIQVFLDQDPSPHPIKTKKQLKVLKPKLNVSSTISSIASPIKSQFPEDTLQALSRRRSSRAGSVNYAEPSLKVKMRRQSSNLVDAIGQENEGPKKRRRAA